MHVLTTTMNGIKERDTKIFMWFGEKKFSYIHRYQTITNNQSVTREYLTLTLQRLIKMSLKKYNVTPKTLLNFDISNLLDKPII